MRTSTRGVFTCALIWISVSIAFAQDSRDFSTSDVTKVVMLGTGNPQPDPNRRGPGVAIVVNEQPYIVDAGEGIWRASGAASLRFGGSIAGLAPTNLSRLFITHLHSDHTVGLPGLILLPWIEGRIDPLLVWGPPGTEDMVENILAAYSSDTAIRRFGPLQANDSGWRAVGHDVPESGLVYEDENVKVEAYRVVHGTISVAFAFRFTTPDKVVVVSGDVRPSPGILEASRDADILIHEVIGLDDRNNQPWGRSRNTPLDLGNIAELFHTTTEQLAELANEVQPGLLVLYHEQNWSDPYDPDALVDEIKRYGYDGEVVSARDQDIF